MNDSHIAIDVKHLIRTICNSAAYGLSSVPNETNQDDTQSFARHFAATDKTITEARKKFNGSDWDQSWADWNSRWMKLKNSEPGKSSVQALKSGK